MALTVLDTCKVMTWLESVKPGATMHDLKREIDIHFGEIKWGGAMGWGEGLITASVGNIKGSSSGDCTSEEALLDLANRLLKHEESEKLNENNCDWL